MTKNIFLLLFSSLSIVVTSKTLFIHNATSSIVVDGSDDEATWTSLPFQDMDQNKGDAANENNTAKFKMCYNADYLYVYVEVLDATIDTSQSKNTWEKDCIDIFFCIDTLATKTFRSGQNAFWQLRKVFGREMTDFTEKGFKASEQDIPGGKSQEWQLAWDSLSSTLKDKRLWDNCNFKFEIENSDNDGSGRNSQLFWNSNADDQWAIYIHMGHVKACYVENLEQKDIMPFFSIENQLIKFKYKSDYLIVNELGSIVKQGYKKMNAEIADLRKGMYIISANGQKMKFIR